MKLLFVFCFLIFGFIEAENVGISIDLINSESPLFPYYNTTRNVSRLGNLLVESPLEPAKKSVSHLMKIKIGTKPVEIFAIADTGSSLVWAQCTPTPTHKTPPFDPRKSSTYKVEAFGSEECKKAPGNKAGLNNQCNYTVNYVQGSSSGVLATDTFLFDSTGGKGTVPFVKSVFGCGDEDKVGLMADVGGVAGLGPGPQSLVSQFSKSKIKRIFSYCLTPLGTATVTKLRFGETAKISAGKGLVTTPIEKHPLHYPITLEAITIGGKYKVTATPQGKGNIIIDSGTSNTFLEQDLYTNVRTLVEKVLGQTLGLKPIPNHKNLLCYATQRINEFPDMIFHFAGSADLTLKPLNTFQRLEKFYCMTIEPGKPILGNYAQVNLQVEYDLEKMMLSFAPFSSRCYTD